jgi:signal transduction histidine kinase
MNDEAARDEPVLSKNARSAICDCDWSRACVGSPEEWPAEWRAALDLCLDAWIPICIAVGPDLELLYNDEFARLTGWQQEATFGRPLRTAWGPTWREQMEPLVAHAMLTDRPISREVPLPPALHPVRLSFSTLHDDLGRPTGLLGIALSDQTCVIEERHELLLHELLRRAPRMRDVEEVWRTCRSLLRQIVPTLDAEALYVLDPDAQLLRRRARTTTSAFTASFPEELTCDRVQLDALDGGLSGQLAHSLDPAGDTSTPLICLPLQGPGRAQAVMIIRRVPNSASELVPSLMQALAVHFGIALGHVLRTPGDSLRHRYASGEAVASPGSFVAHLSQQLTRPLSLLLREIDDLLTSGTVSKGASAQLGIAKRRARRLGRLIDILLTLSRIDDQLLQPRLVPTNVASATKYLCDLFQPAFNQAGIALSADCADLPHPALVDRGMWEKIVCSLLANALKFTLEGEVRVFQYSTAEDLVLVVADTGCGIPDADIELVFEQERGSPSDEGFANGGAKLGLSLTRELVRLHDGTMHISSKLGRGSTFTVRIPYEYGSESLPIVPIDPAAGFDGEASDALEAMREWNDAIDSTAASDEQRILVAAGNADEHEFLRGLLGSRWKVQILSDGFAALGSALARPPALVIADVALPGVDGVSLARALHTDPRTAEVPVVLLSERGREQGSIEGLGAGALDYVVKPVAPRELLARLDVRLTQARERKLERAARQNAERDSQLKDEVIAVVAHELRSPLAAILGWLQVLRSDGFSATRVEKALEVIERNVNAQARLVKDLFDASRMITGKLSLVLEVIPDLRTVVAPAVESFMPVAAASKIRLEAALDGPVGPVAVDPDRFQQVVWNLLANALKFTPAGGTVRITCSMSDHEALLQVSDTGRGITPDFLPHVFERFAQENANHAKRGLGLGLALSHHMIEQHFGAIVAQSEGEGRGTTITISLPLRMSETRQ